MQPKHSWEMFSTGSIENTNINTNTKGKQVASTGKAVIETTRGGYLFRDAFSAFKDALKQNNEKKSHFWLAELCVSGEVRRSWQILLDACIKTIPFVCPSEMVRLYRRVVRMQEKIQRKEKTGIPVLHMLHDCLIILLWCRKQSACISLKDVGSLSKIKVPQDPRAYRKAPINGIHPVVLGTLSMQQDPPNLITGGHELIHAVLRKDVPMMRFWLSWMIQWTPNEVKGKERSHRCQNSKHVNDWIWGIWDLVFALAQHMRLNKDSVAIIRHCASLFAVEYSIGSKKKKFPLLLLAFFVCSTDSWKPIMLPLLSTRIQFGLSLKSFYKTLMQTRQGPTPLQRP